MIVEVENQEEAKEILGDNGFAVWKWGMKRGKIKWEGFVDSEGCQKLIGLDNKCFVAVLLNENEARFIREDKFEEKVAGREEQLQIERIIFGENKDKLYKEGRLILIEEIITADELLDYLGNKK